MIIANLAHFKHDHETEIDGCLLLLRLVSLFLYNKLVIIASSN